jgi:hypothetical protein
MARRAVEARTKRAAAWSTFALAIALIAVALVFTALTPDVDSGASWGAGGIVADAGFALTLLSFPVAGLLLATRRPENAIGWLLLAIGVCWGVAIATSYSDYGLLRHPGSLPLASYVAAIASGFWLPAIGISGIFLILLFPDGKLLTRRWRWVAQVSALGIVLGTVELAITPGPMKDAGYPHTTNPIGISALGGVIHSTHILFVVLPLMMLLAATSLVLRFRRSTGADRQQIKWLACAAAIVAAAYSVAEPLSAVLASGHAHAGTLLTTLQDIALCSFGLIPIAIGIAVLRYRLYDIDRLISRTLSYALSSGLIGGVFLGVIVLTTDVLPFSSPVGVAASTLAAAALFNPLRRRVQHVVDRRFNRARYDADAIIASFSSHLRDAVDIESVSGALLAAVDTVQPVHASVWISETHTRA